MRDTEIDHPEPPAQLSRNLVDAAIRESAARWNDKNLRSDQAERRTRGNGSIKAFLLHARAIQHLPSFGRRMRE